MNRAFVTIVAACLAILAGTAYVGAVTPSGPGQTTAARSVSVVLASDATLPAVTGGATAAHQVTQNGYLDGLETLITATNASLELLKQPTRTAAVTPNDSTDLTATCTKGIWVGTGGNVAVRGAGDSSANTLPNVPSGTYVPGALQRVMSTNTTASGIVCFYGP